LEHDDGVRRAVCVWPAQDLLDFSLRHSEANPSERLAVNAVHRRQEPQRPAKEHRDGNEAGEQLDGTALHTLPLQWGFDYPRLTAERWVHLPPPTQRPNATRSR